MPSWIDNWNKNKQEKWFSLRRSKTKTKSSCSCSCIKCLLRSLVPRVCTSLFQRTANQMPRKWPEKRASSVSLKSILLSQPSDRPSLQVTDDGKFFATMLEGKQEIRQTHGLPSRNFSASCDSFFSKFEVQLMVSFPASKPTSLDAFLETNEANQPIMDSKIIAIHMAPPKVYSSVPEWTDNLVDM